MVASHLLLWRAAALVPACLATGLVVVNLLLRRWLGNLGLLQVYQAKVLGGDLDSEAVLLADAPAEIRDAVQVMDRTAASFRAQFGERIHNLMSALVQQERWTRPRSSAGSIARAVSRT